MIKKHDTLQILGAALILLTGVQQAVAEDFRLQVPKLEFINEHKTFSRGDSLYIKIRNFEKKNYQNLRARLFWGTKEDLPKAYYHVVNGPGGAGDRCYIYDSLPLRVHTNRLGVNLGAVPRTGRHWVVIFEDGDWGNRAIKISQAAVAEYFRRGYQFSVAPPPEPSGSILDALLAPFSRFSSKKPETQAMTTISTNHLQPPVQIAASDNTACIRFRSLNEETLVAEQGRCSGCSKPADEKTAGLVDWLVDVGFGLLR